MWDVIDELDGCVPDHERCACWWHGDRRIGWTDDDFCALHPDDNVPEQHVWEDA